MHAAIASLVFTQVFKATVRRVEGEEFGWARPTERLTQLQQGCLQIQKESIRGIHLKEDLRHLIGPNLRPARVGLQAVAQPWQQQVARLGRALEQIPQDLVQLVVKLTHEL